MYVDKNAVRANVAIAVCALLVLSVVALLSAIGDDSSAATADPVTTPSATAPVPRGSGSQVAGDVNGGGYGDLVCSPAVHPGARHSAYLGVVYGTARGPDRPSAPSWTPSARNCPWTSRWEGSAPPTSTATAMRTSWPAGTSSGAAPPVPARTSPPRSWRAYRVATTVTAKSISSWATALGSACCTGRSPVKGRRAARVPPAEPDQCGRPRLRRQRFLPHRGRRGRRPRHRPRRHCPRRRRTDTVRAPARRGRARWIHGAHAGVADRQLSGVR